MNIAFALKDYEVILTLPCTHNHNNPPTFLLPTFAQFLMAACHLTHDDVAGAWTLFKDAVWSGVVPMRSGTSDAFQSVYQIVPNFLPN